MLLSGLQEAVLEHGPHMLRAMHAQLRAELHPDGREFVRSACGMCEARFAPAFGFQHVSCTVFAVFRMTR